MPVDLVAIGDSLILAAAASDTIPHRLAVLRQTWTQSNKGVSSQTTTQIEARFATDVVAQAPTYVIIEGGINDITTGGSKATFLANWTSMLNQAVAASIIPIALSILPWTAGTNTQLTTRDDWNTSLQALVATYPTAIWVNPETRVGQKRQSGPSGNLWDIAAGYDADGVHYQTAGYQDIARVIDLAIGGSLVTVATYYISPNGNDANNGLGPDASHASNKPWLTLGKALGAAGMASGDTVYIAPGVYRGVTTVTMTSPVAETFILGDPSNAKGFKDGSGVLLDAGDVRISAYTTNDTSAPSASTLLTLNARDNMTFRNLVLQGGTGGVVNNNAGSVSNKFQDCTFITGMNAAGISVGVTVDVAVNLTIDRCIFFGGGLACVDVTIPKSAIADYDVNVVIQNCMMIAPVRGVYAVGSGASAFKGGGVKVWNCDIIGPSNGGVVANGTDISTSIPMQAYNCIIYTAGTALLSGVSGQIVEDYNLLWAVTLRTNVTAGTNSKTNPNYAWLFEIGQRVHSGRRQRLFMMPTFDSPALGFGNQSVGITTDFLQNSKPSGGRSTVNGIGYVERSDTAAKETTTVDAGTTSARIDGPGNQELLVPVDASATTITIRARYDTNHAATNKPQVILQEQPEIGVSTQTVTMTAAVDTWETLTIGPFTPTANGWVRLRLVSRSAAGNGKAFFDTLTVT